eukprot:gb/GEZN01014002.1/.p1 GENE.gb/GEZN01014002.1/~~gb/GEZN01014002.1/.p1  ORF type:complete len:317 (+),score=16.60 gb/GEZN01014002.1/:86-952(+)
MSFQQSQAILSDLLTHYRENTYGRTRYFNEMTHTCPRGCVCRAAFGLCLQSLYELSELEKLPAIVSKYFDSAECMPLEPLLLWLSLQASQSQYETVAEVVTSRLEKDKARVPGFKALSSAEYAALIEFLVFHALLPLGAYRQALQIIESNNNLPMWRRQGFLRYVKKQMDQAGHVGLSADSVLSTSPLTQADGGHEDINTAVTTSQRSPNDRTMREKFLVFLSFLKAYKHPLVVFIFMATFLLRSFSLQSRIGILSRALQFLVFISNNFAQIFGQSNIGRMVLGMGQS